MHAVFHRRRMSATSAGKPCWIVVGGFEQMRLAALTSTFFAALLALVAVAAPAAATKAPIVPSVTAATYATTGDGSERLKGVPISKRPGKLDRVAMSIAPDQFDAIQVGDRLRVNGEVQVSTTCVEPGPRCVGSHYEISPKVTTRIVLSPGPVARGGFMPLSDSRTQVCKQRRPNRNHHCTLTVPNTETTISDLAALPCPPEACYVNLIVGATNRKAKRGNKVVLGGDQPDGSVKQDKGRLNLVQADAAVPLPQTSQTNALVEPALPLTIGDSEKRRVVYSLPIVAPQQGEILTFDTSFRTDITALRFNTFISSRVILAEAPTAAKSTGLAKRATAYKGQGTESNGFNCTLGSSGYTNPCTTVKAGALQITRKFKTVYGEEPTTLYLNVLAGAKPLLSERKVTDDQVVALGATEQGLIAARYGP
jgi:hypothetical protein